MKVLKWVFGILLVLVILVAIALFAVTQLVDLNSYKAQIEAQVYKETGRKLVISGDLDWNWYPSIGLRVGKATLYNPSGYSPQVFARFVSADVSVRLLPLISQQVVVDNITLHDFELNLIERNANENNWTFNISEHTSHQSNKKQVVSPSTKAAPDNDNNKSGRLADIHWSVHQLVIQDAQVQFFDLAEGSHYALKDFDFQGDNIQFGQPFPVKLSFDAISSQPDIQSHFTILSQLTFDPTAKQYQLDKMVAGIRMVMQRAHQKPLTVQATLSGKSNINLAEKTLTMHSHVEVNHILHARVALKLHGLLDQEQYQGDLAIKSFDLAALLRSLGNTVPVFPSKSAMADASGALHFSGDIHQVDVSRITATINHSKLLGELHVKNFAEPTIHSEIHVNQIDVADYANLRGARLPMQDLDLKCQLHMQGTSSQYVPKTLNGQLQFSVRQSTLKGVDVAAMLHQAGQVLDNMLDPSARGDGWSKLQSLFAESQQRINPDNGKKTPIGRFTLVTNIHDGVAKIARGMLSNNDMQVDLSGTLDMNHQNNLDVTLLLYELTEQTVNGKTQRVPTGLKLPYRIHGPLKQLHYGVDWPAFQKQIAEYITRSLQQTIHHTVQQEASKLMQGLFGQ